MIGQTKSHIDMAVAASFSLRFSENADKQSAAIKDYV